MLTFLFGLVEGPLVIRLGAMDDRRRVGAVRGNGDEASTMPITPTMTLTLLVTASPPPSCDVCISTSAMQVFRCKGIAGHFFQGGQHDMAKGAQIRARRGHVGT